MGIKYLVDNTGKRYTFGGKQIVQEYDSLLFGLLEYWMCEDSSTSIVSDSLLRCNLSTKYGMRQDTVGKINKGLTFDTSRGVAVTSTTVAYTNTGNNELSMSAWYKCDSSAGGLGYSAYILRIGGNNILADIRAYNTQNLFIGQVVDVDGGSIFITTKGDTVKANEWQHLVFVCRGIGYPVEFYIDGSFNMSYQSGNLTKNLKTPDGYCYIGNAYEGAYSGPTGGYIDEVGIWNRSLTTDEIKKLYNNGEGLTYPFSS